MSGKKGLDFLKTISSYMVKDGFDNTLQKLKIVGGGGGMCKAQFIVGPEHLNKGGGLHGGFSATLVDVVTTYALMTTDNMPGVSVDIHVSYLKAAKEGDSVLVDATTLKTGKNLAYLECTLTHETDGSIIAKGSHTKFIGKPPAK